MKSCICLLAVTLLAVPFAVGQPAYQEQVNISGATLFENFFKDEASTHDWIDVDGDGYWGFRLSNPFLTDQLALDPWNTSDPNSFWVVQYRGVGSGNGLAELVDWHLLGTLSDRIPSPGVINRCAFAIGGDPQENWRAATDPNHTGDPTIMVDPATGTDYINNIVQSIRDFAPPLCVLCDPNLAEWVCDENVTNRNDPLWCDPNEPWRVPCDPDCTDPNGLIDPNSVHNFMPGEYMARTWTLLDAIDCRPPLNDPTSFVPNPTLNVAVQNYWLNNTTLVVNAYGSNGRAAQWNRVPTREPDPCWDPNPDPNDPNTCLTPAAERAYNDGSAKNYYNYFTDNTGNPNGGSLIAGASLNARNGIQGDFNNDGVRDLNDVCAMLAAINDPVAYATNAAYYTPYVVNPGTHSTQANPVNPFIIGDFNGDGNFDAADVRYFADGLALDPATGQLDRAAAFIAVDECWFDLTGELNFFGTVIDRPGGECYNAGDSRFDVAGGTPTPGAGPNGADGVIDATDRDYIAANFGDWADIDTAAEMDLSCDMNGDLVIDAGDLELIDAAPASLNGGIFPVGTGDCCVGLGDLARLLGNYGTTSGATYYDGDIFPVGAGDGAVNLQDLAQLLGNYGNGYGN